MLQDVLLLPPMATINIRISTWMQPSEAEQTFGQTSENFCGAHISLWPRSILKEEPQLDLSLSLSSSYDIVYIYG